MFGYNHVILFTENPYYLYMELDSTIMGPIGLYLCQSKRYISPELVVWPLGNVHTLILKFISN